MQKNNIKIYIKVKLQLLGHYIKLLEEANIIENGKVNQKRIL